MSDEQQTQQADDPSGEGWRDVEPDEILQHGDMFPNGGQWERTGNPGLRAREGRGGTYRRRIEPQPQAINPDDPRGDGWRDLGLDEPIEQGDVYTPDGYNWLESDSIGRRPIEFPNRLEYPHLRYRRRIEPQQPSDSEPETMEQLREQVRDLTRQAQLDAVELQQLREQVQALTTERDEHARKAATAHNLAEMSRAQVADEAQKIEQLKEQVQALTRERDRYRNQLAGAIEHSSAAAGRQQVLEALQAWLRPVLELVAEHPDDASPLAVAVLGYLPGIASRLIEE